MKTLTYRISVAMTWFALANASEAMDARIEVGENVHLSASHGDQINFYPTIAADPADASRLLAGAIINDNPAERDFIHVVFYRSTDGGRTWNVSLEEPRQRGTSDATIAFGRGGTVFAGYINSDRPGLRLYRSFDAGGRWESPTIIEDNLDRPFLTVDSTSGRFVDRIYCCGVVFADALGGTGGSLNALGLYRSIDGGKTIELPALRIAAPPFYMSGTGNCVVLSDGTVVTLYGFNSEKWNAEQRQARPEFQPKGDALIGVGRSIDGGRTFQKKMKTIGSLYRSPWHSQVYGTIAADPGSQGFRDRIYVVWTTHADGRDRLMFSTSEDGGITWSKPVAVDDRGEGQASQGSDAFLPNVAVNKAGVVAVTWYDTSGVRDKRGWNVYLRASLDGGATWLPSTRVSDTTSDFNGKMVLGTKRPDGTDNDGPGHTSGLAADADGTFHLAWVDNRTSLRQVWTAKVRVLP